MFIQEGKNDASQAVKDAKPEPMDDYNTMLRQAIDMNMVRFI